MTNLTNKKPGQRYSKRELKTRGWTLNMMDEHLTAQIQNGQRYYRAAEVSAREADSEIAQVLSQNRMERDEIERYRSLTPRTVKTAAGKVHDALSATYEKAEIPDELRKICDIAHGYFLTIVQDPPNPNQDRLMTARELTEEYVKVREKGLSSCKAAARNSWLLGYKLSLIHI